MHRIWSSRSTWSGPGRPGLNPFLKQSYLVERRQSERLVGVTVGPMASGERGCARGYAADFRKFAAPPFFEGDDFVIDHRAQSVVHKTSQRKRDRLLGAWAHAAQLGAWCRHLPCAGGANQRRAETGKPTQFGARPPGCSLKCARMEQFCRLAYANIFPEGLHRRGDAGGLRPVPTPPSNGRGASPELSATSPVSLHSSANARSRRLIPTVPVVTFGPFKGREG